MIMVCGEALFDIFVENEDSSVMNMQAIRGGSPYNVAIGLARLGCQVGFFGGLSSDPLGLRLRQALNDEGVNTEASPLVLANTTLAFVQPDEDGVPQYTFYGEGAADRQLHKDDIPPLDDTINALHFGSFSLVVEPVGKTFLHLARLHAGKKLISYDPNIRPTVVADMDVWRSSLQDWLGVADIVKVSHEDLSLLFPEQDPLDVAVKWLAHAPVLVVVTQGKNGAVGFCRQGCVQVAAPTISVTDTVGAGDSFQAALLCGLSQNEIFSKPDIINIGLEKLESILHFAVLASGKTCTRKGADLPYINELAE